MQKYNVLLIISVILMTVTDMGYSQGSDHAGVEVQAYPAGVILGVRGGLDIGKQSELNLRAGYNITRRGDFGKHDNEEGGGAGLGLGYQYYLADKLNGLFMGLRTDLWIMNIDWRDRRTICGTVPPCFERDIEASTDVVVLQPTLETGYDILKNHSDWMLAPTVSFGFEFNIKTAGEEVGEGAILLGGLNLGYKF